MKNIAIVNTVYLNLQLNIQSILQLIMVPQISLLKPLQIMQMEKQLELVELH